MGAFTYPLFANWAWGGGWLANLGNNFGLGKGHCNFAGSVTDAAGKWKKFTRDAVGNLVKVTEPDPALASRAKAELRRLVSQACKPAFRMNAPARPLRNLRS
jgi:hypothetical protein